MPSLAAASSALRVSTSQTASWKRRRDVGDRDRLARPLARLDPARDGGLEPGEREVEAVPLQVAPRGQPAREVDRTRCCPSRAARSMCGPPGNGSPSSRATLSKASPAASSMVGAQRLDADR